MKPKTESEKMADRTFHANRVRKELVGSVGSPFRIHEATEKQRKERRRVPQGDKRIKESARESK